MKWIMVILFVAVSKVTIHGAKIPRERIPIADIALLIDQSGSIGGQYYVEEIEFAKHFAASFPIAPDKTRFALVEFSLSNSTRVRLNWQSGIDAHTVQRTLDQMRYAQLGVGTDFAKAFTVTVDQLQRLDAGDRSEAPNIVVMITDGYLNSKFERIPAFEAARKLRNTGTLIYAIHVKLDPSINRAPIDDLTEMTGNRSRVFAVEDFRSLTVDLLNFITKQITEEYEDCVYEYEANGLCYTNSVNGPCVQDATLKIVRQAQPPYGDPCPKNESKQIECLSGDCQVSCDKWPWDSWEDCIIDVCGINGTRSRHRLMNARFEKLIHTCTLIETRPCSIEEIKNVSCQNGDMAVKVKLSGDNGSKLPVWASILIFLICLVIIAFIISAVVIYKSPRWRMIFVPAKPRKNQLPGNSGNTIPKSYN